MYDNQDNNAAMQSSINPIWNKLNNDILQDMHRVRITIDTIK